jgi:hypothetical protein
MQAKHFGLDNTLRNLYYTLRLKRRLLVAIEFEHGGKKYRADTAKEALDLQRLLEKEESDQGAQPLRHWPVDVALEFVQSLGELQRKFLGTLSQGASVSSEAIVKALGLDSEIALAGVLSGLSKQAKKMNVNPHNIYYVNVDWVGKTKERYFRLMRDFHEALIELNWPDAWEEKKRPK